MKRHCQLLSFVLLMYLPAFLSAMTTKMKTTTTKTKAMSTLKGIVFDMDDTLVRSNLDIPAMYRKIFGNDPSTNVNFDILKDIDDLPTQEERTKAHQIVDEMEEDSRRQMTLMPGCVELLTWLKAHNIPISLVTRNSKKTTTVFNEKLESAQQGRGRRREMQKFQHILTRDDNIPPKPDPTALKIIANDYFNIDLPSSEILMVGDSIVNDIGFGKNAGVQTALLLSSDGQHNGEEEETTDDGADFCVERLTELPRKLWKHYLIDGPLGNTEEVNKMPLHGSPAPKPTTDLSKAVVNGGIATVKALLEELSLDDIIHPVNIDRKKDDLDQYDESNTALIWAAEVGDLEVTKLILDKITAEEFSGRISSSTSSQDASILLSSFINHRGFLGATALNRAARRGHTNVLELLLSSSSGNKISDDNNLLFDINLPNNKLQHPLHFAAFKRHPKTVEFLLKNGADPFVLDRKGRTPREDTSCDKCKSLLEEAMR
jgi:phosphoglycolate phosphatase-like HAD superfamily hydrolase